MNKTSISYLTHTWNPIAMRCTPISPACNHCWHLAMAKRLAANPMLSAEARAAYAGETRPVLLTPRLDEPLRRKKSAMIGVQFMGDLFHERVLEVMIWAIINIAYEAKQHTFLILTKRPARMLDVLTKSAWWNNDTPENIWLGVTVENQQCADERREYLEAVPATIKFVSYEPALGPVDWAGWEFVNLLVSGGETGTGARPSHPQWFRDARDFCQTNEIAFRHKQNGEWVQVGIEDNGAYAWPGNDLEIIEKYPHMWMNQAGMIGSGHPGSRGFCRIGNKRTGHLLDGVEYREFPEKTK